MHIGWRYWQDVWNVLDLLTLVLGAVTTGLIVLQEESPIESTFPILAISSVLVWFRMLNLFRAHATLGPLTAMIFDTCYQMRSFLCVMALLVAGLTHGWFVLATRYPNAHFLQQEDAISCAQDSSQTMHCGSQAQEFQHPLDRFLAAFLFMVRMTTLGDFPGDAFALADYSGKPNDEPGLATALPAWLFFIFIDVFCVVLLLNLLIAIIGDSHDAAIMRAKANFRRDRLCLSMEAGVDLTTAQKEHRYRRFLVFRAPTSMLLTTDEWKDMDGKNGSAPPLRSDATATWEGRVRATERAIKKEVRTLRGELSRLEGRLEGKLEKISSGIDKLTTEGGARREGGACDAHGARASRRRSSRIDELTEGGAGREEGAGDAHGAARHCC
uniref:Ion transport domain-containing protein n=1 Tax=Zooxanthella nutricula TaxID=1333877 RepID=A0A7S2Q6I2_9DINO|mmetsp:Transcript_78677/g.240767  ORF Transcript_78677/g.240767 Transcript_78677/m.240767 type:complete len:384 (+) Transcript_78677:23-1174(+)